MKKRILAFLLAVSMLFAIPVLGAELDYTVEDSLITVTGVTDTGVAGEEVTLVILKRDKTLADLSNATSATIANVVQYIGQTTSGAAGAFTFLIVADDNFDAGLVVASVGGRGFSEKLPLDIVYTDSGVLAQIAEAFRLAQQADGNGKMQQFISDYQPIIGFPMADYPAYSEAVCAYLKTVAISSQADAVKEILAAYNGALLKELISKADTVGSITAALDGYDKAGAFDRTEYEKLVLKGGGEDIVKAAAGKQYATPQDALKGLELAVFLGASNRASNREELQSLFEKYNAAHIGISTTVGSRYDRADKELLFKNLSKRLQKTPVYTREAYISAFESALDETEKGTTVNPPSGGGSGSGGSGGGRVEVPVPTGTPVPTTPPAEEELFDDLGDVPWAKESVERLAEKGIIAKDTSKKFRPGDSITREEYVKMLVSALGILDEAAQCGFADVEAGAWYAPYIASAFESGLVSGISETAFGVGQPITREDIAVLTYRAAQSMGVALPEGEQPSFSDADSISAYALEAVNAMAKAGVINGYEDLSFGAKNQATRAEVAVMLDRFLEIK